MTKKEYKAVDLWYSSDTDGGFLGGGKRSLDLSKVNRLAKDGWEIHTVTSDSDGCADTAILEREVKE